MSPRDNSLIEATGAYKIEEGTKKIIGYGSVDPFSTFNAGKEIPVDCILFKFSSIFKSDILSDISWVPEDAASHYFRPLIWPKSMVQRVKVLGEFDDHVLGTAILVNSRPFPPQELPFKATLPVSRDSFKDINNAVLLCDLSISLESNEDMHYPYIGWYNPKCMRALKNIHFHDGLVPQYTEDICNSIAFLWHKKRIVFNIFQ